MTRPSGQKLISDPLALLVEGSFLFKDLPLDSLRPHLSAAPLVVEKLYSNRPIYTAFRPDSWLDYLYVVIDGGPVIMRSTPLDRVIAMTYPQGCFGTRSLPVGFGTLAQGFPSLVEAYKTTDVVKVPLVAVKTLYEENSLFQQRYDRLLELREKFQYHLLNCSTYPPQAVASLLRALVYQERSLGSQPGPDGGYRFDLPIDLIARACQLNHRTVEQVLKGMAGAGYLRASKSGDHAVDQVHIVDPEELKEVYGATRDKVSWWPLK
ncbi:MAG TPA: Crp/Fnr family transcriptional regulator [Nodosilinea sp.]|nr:Crp/Fnr family transcriptional regulator [Nodosilinea sp.]